MFNKKNNETKQSIGAISWKSKSWLVCRHKTKQCKEKVLTKRNQNCIPSTCCKHFMKKQPKSIQTIVEDIRGQSASKIIE